MTRFFRWMRTTLLAIVVPSLAACLPIQTGPDSWPGGCQRDPRATNQGFPIDQRPQDREPQTVGNDRFGNPICIGQQITNQHVIANAGGSLFAEGDPNTITVCIPDGTYTADVHPVVAKTSGVPPRTVCVAQGSISVPVKVRFSLKYKALFIPVAGVERICIYKSKAEYDKFEVTIQDGPPHIDRLDDLVLEHVRDDILAQIDKEVADFINEKTPVSHAALRALTAGESPRCNGPVFWEGL